MRATRTTIIAIAAAGLAAGVSLGVAAQPGPEVPAYATGSGTAGPADVESPNEVRSDEGRRMEGLVFHDIPVEFDDERLSGLLTIAANGSGQDFTDGYAHIESRTYRIENDDGAWTGSGMFAAAERGGDFLIAREAFELTGEGAYEGLTAFVVSDWSTGGLPRSEAVILSLEMAPAPQPIAAP